MGLAQQCKFFGHIITIEKALAIREGATPENRHALPFECDRCGSPVRPRAAGDKHVAHFVHVRENRDCSYTEAPRGY